MNSVLRTSLTITIALGTWAVRAQDFGEPPLPPAAPRAPSFAPTPQPAVAGRERRPAPRPAIPENF
jgi:hypothetical protein